MIPPTELSLATGLATRLMIGSQALALQPNLLGDDLVLNAPPKIWLSFNTFILMQLVLELNIVRPFEYLVTRQHHRKVQRWNGVKQAVISHLRCLVLSHSQP